MQGDLPWVCQQWTGNIVLLVWGKTALNALLTSKFLKGNPPLGAATGTVDTLYAVLVFEAGIEACKTSDVKMYGGLPILVVDISRVENITDAVEKLLLHSGGVARELWGLNLPFWMPRIHTVKASDPVSHSGLYKLFLGSQRIKADRIPQAVSELIRSTIPTQTELAVCKGCFVSQSHLKDRPHCNHLVCDSCSEQSIPCFCVSHKKELVSHNALEKIWGFLKDDDIFLF